MDPWVSYVDKYKQQNYMETNYNNNNNNNNRIKI